jgi:hypothetical protein
VEVEGKEERKLNNGEKGVQMEWKQFFSNGCNSDRKGGKERRTRGTVERGGA